MRERDNRVDIVLGDNHGEACAPILIDGVEQWMSARGLRVRRNQPYAGGFTTQRYGRPGIGRHVLQIEINRALYMDETSFEKGNGFHRLRDDLEAMVTSLTAGISGLAVPRAAAE